LFVFSFVSNTSFIAFPSLGSRPEVRLTFDLKSRASTGIILFNSGGPLYTDFVAVELVSGHVTLYVNKGAGDVTMTSRAPVDDGDWHQVSECVTACRRLCLNAEVGKILTFKYLKY